MKPITAPVILCTLGILGTTLASIRPASSAESRDRPPVRVTATLHDGRQISGEVDAQTDREHLWLRRKEAGMEIASGIAWSKLRHVESPYGPWDLQEVRRDPEPFASPATTFLDLLREARPSQPALAASSPAPVPPARPHALRIQSELGYWDDDAASDGLWVHVLPLDDAGTLVPVRGQLELMLVVEYEYLRGGQRVRVTPHFETVERTSHIVVPVDFQDGAGHYRLPFSRVHPDLALDAAAEGLVHARLGINGVGILEASDSRVCLREPSRFRDELQHHAASRFLPLEGGAERARP